MKFNTTILCILFCWEGSAVADDHTSQLLSLGLEELGKVKVDMVFAASKAPEKVTDAPASVTVVSRDEIARFGYRTLAEIMRATRGFDVTYDRNYTYSGARGYNRLGDYGSHILLLIDGHRMNDPIFDTTAIGTEGLLDVDLIERVEFIRGPGSGLYGGNAALAVVNVVTRSGASVNGVEASVRGGSFETYSGRLTLGKKLPNGLEYLFSATTYASQGPAHLFYKEFDTPQTNRGIASYQDGDRYWSAFGKVKYGNFTLEGGYVTRDKNIPTGSYGSIFNKPNFTVDSRGYLELGYTHETVNGWFLGGRAYYDVYDYRQLASFDNGDGPVVNDDSARARWWGAEINASRTFFSSVRLSLGADVKKGNGLRQRNYDNSPFASYLDVSNDQTNVGAYLDGRWAITKSLSLSTGVRWDYYNEFGNTLNPHAALIWKPLEGTSLKLLYADASPTPNVYQLGYTAVGQIGNPNLQAENLRTYELVFDQYFANHWRGSISLFRNQFNETVDSVRDADGLLMFKNSGSTVSTGAEAEIEGKWDNGLLLRASYTWQDADSENTGLHLVNSPYEMLKAHVSIPLFRDKLFGSLEMLYTSDRFTRNREHTGEAWLLNATIYSREIAPGLEFSASVYNLLDRRYRIPGGDEHLQETLSQDGRTFGLKVTYRF